MAPEQGPDSKSKAEKPQRLASDEESVPISDNNQQNTLSSDTIGWIYLLKKDQLVEQCQNVGIATAGFTVDYLRKKLSEVLRTKRLRASSENLLRELENEVKRSEERVINDEITITPIPSTNFRLGVPDAEVMSTVQKWNLRFSGDSDLMEFLERVEELAECYQIHNDRLLPAMLGILSGNALKWYRVKRSEIRCWDEFRTEIQKFFLPKRFLSQIEQNFYNRRQNNRERAKEFILNMLTLARQHPNLRNRDHLDRIYDGLRPEYRHYVRRNDFSSLDDLISMTDEFEALKREERPQPTHMITPKKYKRQEVCWRCKQRGHYRYSCTNERILFCSYCGRDGTFSSSCGCRKTEVNKSVEGDDRCYIPITINGLKIKALIDTGSSKTHINERVANHLTACGIPHTNNHEVVQMADKSLVTLTRRFEVVIFFRHTTIPMYVSEIPTLAEDVILGMDFLTACGIEIRLGGRTLLTGNSNQVPVLYSLTTPESLATRKSEQLQALQEKRPTEFDGLCSVAKHKRPIKQRNFPRNPAMIEVVISKIDNVLSEGKIELSQSSSSSPITPAKKKEKRMGRKATRPTKPNKHTQPPKKKRATLLGGIEKPIPYQPLPVAHLRTIQDIKIIPPATSSSLPLAVTTSSTEPPPSKLDYIDPSTPRTSMTSPTKPDSPNPDNVAPVTVPNRMQHGKKKTGESLLKGIVVPTRKKYKRHLQYYSAIHRPQLPPEKVAVLNREFTRFLVMDRRK